MHCRGLDNKLKNKSSTFLISYGKEDFYYKVDQGGRRESRPVMPLDNFTHILMESDKELSNKKVKFAYEPDEFEGEGNDLDLDTIRASRNKSKGLKEFDSEGSEDEDEDLGLELDLEEQEQEQDHKEEIEEDLNSANESIDERQVPLTPFNLREDREEGNFDSEGFYTRKQDEEADQDRWMANFTLTDILKARKAHEEREKAKAFNSKEKSKATLGKSEKQLWEELADSLVENDLTVLETIRQLTITPKQETQKPRAPLNKNRLKKLQKEQQAQAQEPKQEHEQPNEGKLKMERITELADALMDFGNFGVYEETRRGILRKLNK
jgi:CD2 antigen cytoplasmic tail-binding protein 2